MLPTLPADLYATPAPSMQYPMRPPMPSFRYSTWAQQPSAVMRAPGTLSSTGLGLVPTSYASTASSDWKLLIGQAHGPGLPTVNSMQEAEALASTLEATLMTQWNLPAATEGMSRLQHKPGMPNYAVAIRLKGSHCPAANGLMRQLCTAHNLHVSLPTGMVCVPAVDYGASSSLQAVRILVLGLDPLAHRAGITAALIQCAGYEVSEAPGPGRVRVVSEQAGAPRLGGVADITTVVAYIIPPPDDPLLHRLPVSFVDNHDNVTHVLVYGDTLSPPPDPRAHGYPQPSPAPPPPPRPAYHAPHTQPPPPPLTAPAIPSSTPTTSSNAPTCPSPPAPPQVPAAIQPVAIMSPTSAMRHSIINHTEPAMSVHAPLLATAAAPAAPLHDFNVIGPVALPTEASSALARTQPPELIRRPTAEHGNPAAPLQVVLEYQARFTRASTNDPESGAQVEQGPAPFEGMDVEAEAAKEDAAEVAEEDMTMSEAQQATDTDIFCLPLPPPPPPVACTTGADDDPPGALYPVSDGSAHREMAPEEVRDEDPHGHAPASRPHPADFGDGSGYSLGRPAALQAGMLASGPAAMQDVEDASGNPVIPPNHLPVLSPHGDTQFVPVHQLAIQPPAEAKLRPRDRSGIGASPEYATWAIKAAMTQFIAAMYGPQLEMSGMPTAMECAMAVLQRGRHWWSLRREQTEVDKDMTRRIDEYMRSVSGETRGPRPVLLHAKASTAPEKAHRERRCVPSTPTRAPSLGRHRKVVAPVKNPASPPPRSHASHVLDPSPSGGGGRVDP